MTGNSQQIWTGDDLSEQEFAAIAELLLCQRQLDLDHYKDRCIRRRIARRLRARAVRDVDSYLGLLRTEPEELDTLAATLSIHVSQFFRNPDTYRVMEQSILPDLCSRARKNGRSELVLWSAGCAAGEEAYSLALLADDLAAPGLEIRILATDISEPVLETARQAIFSSARIKEVPPAVLSRYFDKMGGDRYRLIDRIRSKVRFAQHNIMTEEDYPPADLILCRNVLIYFTREEQERILARFAAALPEQGALVLGRSETLVGDNRRLFHPEFPTERIYRRTAQAVTAAHICEGAMHADIS